MAPPGLRGTMPAVTRPFGMTHWVAARGRTDQPPPVLLPRPHDRGFLGTTSRHPGWATTVREADAGWARSAGPRPAVSPRGGACEAHRYRVTSRRGGPIRATLAAPSGAVPWRSSFRAVPPRRARGDPEQLVRRGVRVDPGAREITGFNPIATRPTSVPASRASGATSSPASASRSPRSAPGRQRRYAERERNGTRVGAYATFEPSVTRVRVKVATSFLGLDEARRSLDRTSRVGLRGVAEAPPHWEEALGVVTWKAAAGTTSCASTPPLPTLVFPG